MTNFKLPSLLIGFLLTCSTLLIAQEKYVPLSVSFFNEATALPFTEFITTPIHPGIQIGSEVNYAVRKHARFFQSANLSYFYHRHLAQGIGLHSSFGYEYRTGFGIELSGLIGIGYMHTFATAKEYTFTNGSYEKQADKGNSRFFPSISVELGYYLDKDKIFSPKVFLRYQSWAEYPYSPGFIPVMTHINLHLGATIFISKKESK